MAHQNSNGIGFVGLLTILFIGLKLTNHITWSWWWVLSPVWISFALIMTILVIGIMVAIIVNKD
jgi:predicted tellurium resistance membrane protein TerC